ncbi:MAG TPA: response regulator transcription factor [Polyangiaceae bacterium]|nr:response regulator transcription factor [Polyangiaceae bacterium]
MKLRQAVLVVEPSDKLAALIRAGLKAKGFELTTAKRGTDAIRAATTLASDVIVANASLPDMAGGELRRAILQHEEVADLPLVLYQPQLAARLRYRFIIEPDLYASAPVSLPRFCLRVCALSRPRGGRAVSEVCEAGILKVDTMAHRVFVKEREVSLTALEFRLLVTFMSSPERVLSREQLLREVWGIRAHADTRTVDTSVKRLRQKLGPAAPAIETVRSVGYRFLDSGPGFAATTTTYARATSAPMPSTRSAARGVSPAGEAS